MSETVFNLFKNNKPYKATVRKNGKDLISYNVTVDKNDEFEKVGLKLLFLIYEPASEPVISNPYVDVKKILLEQIIQGTDTPILDTTVFIGPTNERSTEKYTVVTANTSGNTNSNTTSANNTSGNLLFSLITNGTIERTILGKSSSETYSIIYTEQPLPPSKPNYKLWFNLVAWFSSVIVLIIAILSLIQGFSKDYSKSKIWAIFLLSLIVIGISVAGISVTYKIEY